MASSARIDEIKKKFDENPRRYFAPLANEFRKAGDLEQAIVICEEFLPQQAGHMSGHIVYGQALYEAGRLPESRNVFETALGLDPENLIALRHLGDIARAQGELADARRWYDRVLDADPRNDEIQGLIALLDGLEVPAPAAWSAPVIELEAIELHEESHQPAGAMPLDELVPMDLDIDSDVFDAAAPSGHDAPIPMGSPVTAPFVATPDAPFDAISLDGLEPTSAEAATDAGMPEIAQARAEGLESTEFAVPVRDFGRAEGLEAMEFEVPTSVTGRAEGLEVAEFEIPSDASTDRSLLDLEGSFAGDAGSSMQVPAMPGLEEAGAAHPPALAPLTMPALELDEGLSLSPHGDELSLGAPAPLASDSSLVEAAGPGSENPRMEPPAAMEAMPALEADPLPELDGRVESVSAPLEPSDVELPEYMELPPSVIAAESELMDAGDADDASAEAETAVAGAQPPFVTETMAELYLKQGFRDQALDVFRQLSDNNPDDARLRARVDELEGERADEAAVAALPAGPTVREFFFRLATRLPGERAEQDVPPAADDFASFTESAPESPLAVEDSALSAPLPVEEEDTPPQASTGASGTIDALFGSRTTPVSEDSAASALAQAFGGASDDSALRGHPARAATAELSLDSVFRDGPTRPPRVSQSFSFDQFFSENAAAATGAAGAASDVTAPGEPAERSADDIQQFNSWLQGLKQQ